MLTSREKISATYGGLCVLLYINTGALSAPKRQNKAPFRQKRLFFITASVFGRCDSFYGLEGICEFTGVIIAVFT